MTTTNVAAVIVTYNRADKLGKVIEQVLAQDRPADQVIIVDNASTDSTAEVLATYEGRPTVHVERLGTNSGGAGGFAHGMSVAYERGADSIWIMDDDCYADPDALRQLLDGHAAAEASMGTHAAHHLALCQGQADVGRGQGEAVDENG